MRRTTTTHCARLDIYGGRPSIPLRQPRFLVLVSSAGAEHQGLAAHDVPSAAIPGAHSSSLYRTWKADLNFAGGCCLFRVVSR
jgi:hypothetical protein